MLIVIVNEAEGKQQGEQKDKASNGDKAVQAVRANGEMKIDGELNESIWQNGGYSDFIQSDPKDGAEPTEKTTVWVAYDDSSLYVAARLYDSAPDKIVSLLGRRDDFLESDWFIFAVDPYFDRRTGFQFAVNPAGTIVDWTLYNDEWNDTTWDGVWESATKVDEQGWVVEMRIPYHQLRFEKKDMYQWGVNFKRVIKRKNENLGFVWIPKEESGYVSRFARLEGMQNINPGRLLEVMPFVVGQSEFSPSEEGNPFETGKDFLGNAGVDLKYGVRNNLILDATVNPDFGQVEVDPAVINLGAYETYYEEKRPFFIEGLHIFEFGYGGSNNYWSFNWNNPSFFYSRRIGRAPQGDVSNNDAYSNYPPGTTILTAGKLTGQIVNGWNMGVISALTQREYANLELDGDRWREEVEPFTYYGVFRAQKEFNDSNQGLGFISTIAARNLRTDNLEDQFNQNALAFAADGWTFLDDDKTWVVTAWMGGTRLSGSIDRIYDVQKNPIHYFQRPDATHVNLDPNATSLSGWAGRYMLNKQKGNFIFNAAFGLISPGFDSTDLGFQWRSDLINHHVVAGYRSFHPGKIFRNWTGYFFTARTYNFDRDTQSELYGFSIDGQWLNYWGSHFQFNAAADAWSDSFTRGGPVMLDPSSQFFHVCTHSDDRKPIIFSIALNYGQGRSGYRNKQINMSFSFKPRSNITFSISPSYSFERSYIQWIDTIEDELMTATYGDRYVFATINRHTVEAAIRANITFRPNLSLQAYFQPYVSVGKYDRFKEFAMPRTFDFNIFGMSGSTIYYEDGVYTVDPDGPGPAESFSFDNPDFNYKSLRGTVVLRYEFKLGSTLYFVWTQTREDGAYPGDVDFSRDLGNLFKAPGSNIFLVKLSYRFNL